MLLGLKRARLAGCLMVLVAPMLMGAIGVKDDFAYRLMMTHNLERARVGAPPLRWNPDLAVAAESWADYLAATGKFEHAPENPLDPEGENIWAGSKGRFALESMTAAWIREKKFFRPGLFPNNSTTGRVEDVGHYTQVVWRDTREVGCAIATSHREDILVCRYAQAGNWRGERPF